MTEDKEKQMSYFGYEHNYTCLFCGSHNKGHKCEEKQMSIDERLREFIWERCEADDLKTDEILAEIKKVIAEEAPKGENELNCRAEERGYNAYRTELLSKLGVKDADTKH